jgi:nicotinamidase-related amidase
MARPSSRGSDLLLVIGMQEGFRSPHAERIIPTLERLLSSWDGDAVFACLRDAPGSLFERQLGWRTFQHTRAQRVLAELRSYVRAVAFHQGYTVLTPELLHAIRKKGYRSLALCGVFTDVSVMKAAMDAFDNGILAYAIDDACATEPDAHAAAISALRRILGESHVLAADDHLARKGSQAMAGKRGAAPA